MATLTIAGRDRPGFAARLQNPPSRRPWSVVGDGNEEERPCWMTWFVGVGRREEEEERIIIISSYYYYIIKLLIISILYIIIIIYILHFFFFNKP